MISFIQDKITKEIDKINDANRKKNFNVLTNEEKLQCKVKFTREEIDFVVQNYPYNSKESKNVENIKFY